MSHVFISYKKEDTYQLRALVSVLKEAGIPFWADIEIEAGTGWRDEIDAALEQSFALVVIVTSASMLSQYVTFEWSWALGAGVPVIPLLFQPATAVQIHQRLQNIQYITCYPDIPSDVIKTLRAAQKKSSLVKALNLRVNQILHPLRIFGIITFWWIDYITIHRHDDENLISESVELFREFLGIFGDIIKNDLPEFWVASSSAFPLKQKRSYEQLVEALDGFYSDPFFYMAFQNFHLHADYLDLVLMLRHEWREKIEPLFLMFPSEAEQSFYEIQEELDLMNEKKVKRDDDDGLQTLNNFNNYLLGMLRNDNFRPFTEQLNKLKLFISMG